MAKACKKPKNYQMFENLLNQTQISNKVSLKEFQKILKFYPKSFRKIEF